MIKRVVICKNKASQGWCELGMQQVMNRTLEMFS
jgi:hypothetical protein